MDIGVRNICFRTRTIEEGLDQAAELGLTAVQLAPQRLGLDDWSAAKASQLRTALESRGLRLTGLSAGPNLVDPARSEQSLAAFEQILRAAAELGAPAITGEVKAVPPGVSPAVCWETCVANVGRVAVRAEELGVVYGVEPGPHCLLNSTDRLELLLDAVDSPGLGVNLDPANLNSAGSDPIEATRRVGSRIVHTHAKDSHREADGAFSETALGEGDVDFPAWLAALAEVGYDGVLCLEREAGPDPMGDVRAGVERLRGWLGGS